MSFTKIDECMAGKLLNHHPAMIAITSYENKFNMSPVAWWSVVNDYPLHIILSLHHKSLSYELAKKDNFLSMNIFSYKFADLYRKSGTISGHNIDKFELFKLNYKFFEDTNLPYMNESLVSAKCLKLANIPLDRFDVFIYQVEYIIAKEIIMKNGLIKWDNYKTLHFINDTDYFTNDTKYF